MYHIQKKHESFLMIWYSVTPIGKKTNLLFILISCFNRPSTPIQEVLQNRFLNNWLETMQNKQAALDKERADAAVNNFVKHKLKGV